MAIPKNNRIGFYSTGELGAPTARFFVSLTFIIGRGWKRVVEVLIEDTAWFYYLLCLPLAYEYWVGKRR